MKIAVVFYSHYGHMVQMAKAAAEGAKGKGAEVRLLRMEETLSEAVLRKTGGWEAQKAFADIPVATPEDLAWADGVVFGLPTRYGNISSQAAAFFDSTGQIWASGGLVGKVGSVMSSSATQHGGAVSTIHAAHHFLLAHGMVVAGLPYAKFSGLFDVSEMNGGSVFGATSITGGQGERMPSQAELAAARAQGAWTAELAEKLA